MSIRVRFAPSPTGDMHIGNLRTAILNWLFAWQNNGKFFLRIEDTDESRSNEKYVENIINILKWMGLNYEDNIIYQSHRLSIYEKYAKILLDKSYAFYCQCVNIEEKEKLDSVLQTKCLCKNNNYQSGMVRLTIPENKIIEFQDMVYGKCIVNSNEIEQFGLLRANGTPLYNFSVVIDDIFQEISHVIRGEDHKTNTFKQILLYEALECTPPQYAHLPMILGFDGKKLSKRKESNNIQFLINEGIISDALFNIAVKLGWGYKDEEHMTRNRIKEIWSLNKVKKSPSTFHIDKLYSFSGYFFRNYDYKNQLIDYIKLRTVLTDEQVNIINHLYEEVSKRAKSFKEAFEQLEFIWKKPINYINKELYDKLNELSNWNEENINILVKDYNIKLREYITGRLVGFDLKKILLSLGQKEVLSRFLCESK